MHLQEGNRKELLKIVSFSIIIFFKFIFTEYYVYMHFTWLKFRS